MKDEVRTRLKSSENADPPMRRHGSERQSLTSSGVRSDPSQADTTTNIFMSLSQNDSWALYAPQTETEVQDISRVIEDSIMQALINERSRQMKLFELSDAVPFLTSGMKAIVSDEFTKCFKSPHPKHWNWNVYLYPVWCIGLFCRYVILFPLRLICLLLGAAVCVLMFLWGYIAYRNPKQLRAWQRKCIQFLCFVFLASWSGVVRYHGVPPARKVNQIFVCNHTTVLDIVVLQQQRCYSIVGQKHPGVMGFFQKHVLSCVGCMWFDRSEAADRAAVSRKIKEHINNPNNDPLLLFPEGTCVNNKYCIMFKKGAFEVDAVVCPVAIKYNRLFCDAFFNSRTQTFVHHLFRLMTNWALVADVYYLEPQTINPGETPTEFANRVKEMIATRAGLRNLPWDGYLKYFRPSQRFTEYKQKVFASGLLSRMSTADLSGLEGRFMSSHDLVGLGQDSIARARANNKHEVQPPVHDASDEEDEDP